MDLTSYIATIDTSEENASSYVIDDNALWQTEARVRSVIKSRANWLDTSPSSVIGRLCVSPISEVVAMFEQAADCVLSDMVLENAVNGVVCDCAFVENFLKSLGVTELVNQNTIGTVRFVFNENKQYNISIGTQILFNENYVCNIYNPSYTNNYVKILPYTPGSYSSEPVDGVSTYHLTPASVNSNNIPNSFYVDVPIYGPASAEISAGSQGALNETESWYSNVVSVTCIYDVEPFVTPTDLSSLITLTRQIQPCSNLTTRSGIISYFKNKFPGIGSISPVLNQDFEISKRSPYGLNTSSLPKLDLYVKSSHINQSASDYVYIFGPDESGKFYCNLRNNLQHIPVKMISLTSVDGTASFLNGDEINDSLLSFCENTYDFYTDKESFGINGAEIDGYNNYIVQAFTPTYDPDAENGSSSQISTDNLTITNNGETLNLSLSGNLEFDSTDAEDIYNKCPIINLSIKNFETTEDNGIKADIYLNSEQIPSATLVWEYNNISITDLHGNAPWFVNGLEIKLLDADGNEIDENYNISGFLEGLPSTSQFNVTYWTNYIPAILTYYYDAALQYVKNTLINSDVSPVIDTLIKPLIPIEIKNFEVKYTKMSGKYVNRQQLQDDIYEFLNTLTYPMQYDDAYIADIAIKNGASSILGISVNAVLRQSQANEYTTDTQPEFTIEPCAAIPLSSLKNIKLNGTEDQPYGYRNVSFIVEKENIVLTESML